MTLNPWASVLAHRGTQQVNVLCIGDSITEGTACNTNPQRWTNQLQDLLREAFPTDGTGIGFCEAYDHTGFKTDEPVRTSTGSQIAPMPDGIGYRGVAMAAGDVTFPPRTCTHIRVWFSSISVAGRFTVTVDGGTPFIVPCSSGRGEYHDDWFDIPFDTSDDREVVLAFYDTGTPFFPSPVVSGVEFYDGNTPVGSYRFLPGPSADNTNPITALDRASFDLSDNEHTFRVKFRASDPATGTNQYLIARADTLASKMSYLLILDGTGLPKLYFSTDGSTWNTETSDGDPLEAGVDYWLEAKLTRNDGGGNCLVDFRIATDETDDPEEVVGWAAHGTQQTGAAVIALKATDVSLRIGAEVTGFLAVGEFRGRIYAAQVKDGSTVVADPIFTRWSGDHVGDSAGNTWRNGTSVETVLPDGGTGIEVINAGKSGATADTFVSGIVDAPFPTYVTVSELRDWLVNGRINMIIVALAGTNEWAGNTDPETYRDNLQTVVDELRLWAPDVAILFIAWYAPFSATAHTYDWDDYNAVTHDVQERTPNSWIEDFTVDWPQPTVAGYPGPTDPSGLYFDGFHPGAAGHTAIAERLGDRLILLADSYQPFAAAIDQPGPTDPLRRVPL